MRSFRFVLTPKWLAFHALTWFVLIPAFIWLGFWQRGLWQARDRAQGIVLGALAAKPVALDSVDPAGHAVAQSQQWTMVSATGHYDPVHQFMVRNRSQNENPGWYVVTPLVLADGSAVLVNQGWVPESQTTDNPLTTPPFPPVPAGRVTVSGALQPDETTATTRIRDDTAVLPTDEVALIAKPDMSGRVPYQLHDGSIQLTGSSPAPAPGAAQLIPGPSYDNTMYIAYMIQWWVFALVMPFTWFKLILREADELAAAAEEDDDDYEDYEDYEAYDEDGEDGEYEDGGGEDGASVAIGAGAVVSAGTGTGPVAAAGESAV